MVSSPHFPKTFKIQIKRPFGEIALSEYTFFLHSSSPQEALGWINRTLPGLDTSSVERIISCPDRAGKKSRESDDVSIVDCDQLIQRFRRHGTCVRVQASDGSLRKSPSEVHESWLFAFNRLVEDYRSLSSSFDYYMACLQRGDAGSAWHLQCVKQLRSAAQMAALWQKNLWAAYVAEQDCRDFSIPAHFLEIDSPANDSSRMRSQA